MAQPNKKKKSLNVTFLSSKRFLPVVSILLFAAIGSYFVFFSQAASQPSVWIGDSAPTSESKSPGGTTEAHPTDGNLILKGNMPDIPTGQTLYLNLAFLSTRPDASKDFPLAYNGYTCAAGITCEASDHIWYNNDAQHRQDVAICVPIDSSKSGATNLHLLTLHYNSQQANLQENLVFMAGWTGGSCVHAVDGHIEPDYISNYTTIGHYSIGTNIQGPTGPNGQSQSKAKTGGGASGGGGSTAKTQSNNPNTVPSSSSQGTETTQPVLEASPFFDGKQYEPGSDPDILGTNTTFSIAGHNLKYGWLYVGVLLLITGGGYYVWKRPGLIRKLKQYIGLC